MYLIMYTVAYSVYLPPTGRSGSVKKYCPSHDVSFKSLLTIDEWSAVTADEIYTITGSSPCKTRPQHGS